VTLLFHIPPVLRAFSAGQSSISISDSTAATVGDALVLLFSRHPGIRDRVVDERGQVRQHVNVFLGVESIRFTGGLGTPIPPAASHEISIVPAVSGGTGSEVARWA